MEEDYKVLSLDKRIENNLKEIYENEIVTLKKIIEFVEQYKKFKLTGAVELSELFKTETDAETKKKEAISTHGMPGFFAGKRDADTVMVMLNPGQDVALANNPITTYDRINRGNKIRKGISIKSLQDFIDTYKVDSENYGDIDKDRADNFDLKQAAFLKHWDDCGVDFAGFLNDDYKKLRKGEEDVTKKENINKEAKRNVLMQKLSLDLIPYASRKFGDVKSDKMEFLFPYLETLFDEIFSKKDGRKYVIFCSDFYERLFKNYNKWEKRNWEIDRLNSKRKENIGVLKNKVYCRPITIRQIKGDKKQNAIIAHTFPNQSLPNAYEKMEKYGRFCFDVWKEAFPHSSSIK